MPWLRFCAFQPLQGAQLRVILSVQLGIRLMACHLQPAMMGQLACMATATTAPQATMQATLW